MHAENGIGATYTSINLKNIVNKEYGKPASASTLKQMWRYVQGMLPGAKKVSSKKETCIEAGKDPKAVNSLLHTICTTHYCL